MSQAVSAARACVEYYRKLGLCPLPSRMDIKGPLLHSYTAHYGDKPVPRWVYEKWNTTNIQVITGAKSPTPTKVVIVDLDGPEAVEAWERITFHHGYTGSKNWISTTGSGGKHLWFRLADDVQECPSGIIWGLWDTWGRNEIKPGQGDWCKHREIRLLADRALAVAPPSIHVDTGIPYEFDDSASPRVHRLPALAPEWLLGMRRLSSPRFADPAAKVTRIPATYYKKTNRHYTREEVISALGDHKLGIAQREWGLNVVQAIPNLNGWCSCYVPGRESPKSSRPSGSFHFHDGTFQDRKDLTSLSFFDLGVVLGAFKTWQECRDSLGDRYIGARMPNSGY